MNNLVLAGISPHPPIIIPAVGGTERLKAKATCEAMEEWARVIRDRAPETIVVISPHGTVFQDAITFKEDPEVCGNFGQFGAGKVQLKYSTDLELGREIKKAADRLRVPVVGMDKQKAKEYGANPDLDHGAMVPLYFLNEAGVRCRLVSVTMGLLSKEELYAFGMAVRRAADSLNRRVILIASGDLSHRLTQNASAGFHPQGQEFDALLTESLREFRVDRLLNMDACLPENAGECGLRPITMLLGALDGLEVEPEVLSYEGPFGVGYLVAYFTPRGENPQRELLPRLLRSREEAVRERRSAESEPVQAARESLEHYVRSGQLLERAESRIQLPPELAGRAGVFVSLKKHGQLRGCIGTTAPTKPTILEEIQANAVSAGTGDPRFWPVEEDELNELVYSVDILGTPEPIEDTGQLDPKKYGVIVSVGGRSGLLLPNLDGVESVDEQLTIAKQKAGIRPEEPVRLQRFEVVRYH